jgi:sortase A
MLYGHSSGYPWDISEFTKIFRKINELTVGDRAYVTYNGKVFVYEVTKHETVNVDDATPFQPNADGEELILYTCWPPDTVDQRYLVHLKPVDIVASR